MVLSLVAEDVELIIIVVVLRARAGSEADVRRDPVAYLAPFGIGAGGGVGVGEGDC